jgi:hypothetical protein
MATEKEISTASGCLVAGCMVWGVFLVVCVTIIVGKVTMMVLAL